MLVSPSRWYWLAAAATCAVPEAATDRVMAMLSDSTRELACRTISASLLFAASRASVLASTASVRSLSGVGAVGVVEPVELLVLVISSRLRSTLVWMPST